MIIKRVQPEIAYRKIDALNQSMLGVFDDDPAQFYSEFIMGEERKQKPSKEMLIGTLTDFYLLDCNGDEEVFTQRFHEQFSLYEGVKGTGQAFLLADYLYEITKRDTNEANVVTTSFIERFKEAFERIQADGKYSKKKWESAMEEFDTHPAGQYFLKLVENTKKQVVDMFIVEKAKFLTQQALTDSFTKDLYSSDKEDLRKFAIEFLYEHNKLGIKCKGELDQILIDHDTKTIYPIDMKCTFDNEMFEYSYIKRKYYLQNAYYNMAVKSWAKNNDMANYKVEPMQFVVYDTSKNGRRPLIYQTTEKHVEQGLKGFMHNGVWHRGVEELVDGIVWASDNNIWNITKENYDAGGKIPLRIF